MSNYSNVPILVTGVFLHLKTALEQGEYNVILRVFDQHKLYQDSSIQATVCDCTGDEVGCTAGIITVHAFLFMLNKKII